MTELAKMTLDPLKIVGTFIDNYAIVDYIATGGTSHIYLGELHSTQVVIKLLKPELSREPDARRRFHKEAYVHKQLNHPNIIELVYEGRFKNEPYMVLEYAPSGSLQDYVEYNVDPLTLGDVAIIIQQIASALHHLHENNIIHRDVKPGNIMMRSRHDVALADFGIVRTEDVNMRFGVQPGTLDFMAPEQIEGLDADYTTDQFSLAVLTYWLLTGEKPFTAETREEASLQRKVGIIPPQDFNHKLPDALHPIFQRALHVNMAERFTFIEEFVHRVVQVIEEYGLQDLPALGSISTRTNIIADPDSLKEVKKPRTKYPRLQSWMEPYGWISLSLLGFMILIIAIYSKSPPGTSARGDARPPDEVMSDLWTVLTDYNTFDCDDFVPLYYEIATQVTLANSDYANLAGLTDNGSPTKTVFSSYCTNPDATGHMNPELWNAMIYELGTVSNP